MYEMYILLWIDVISVSLLIMKDLSCLYIPCFVFSVVFCLFSCFHLLYVYDYYFIPVYGNIVS